MILSNLINGYRESNFLTFAQRLIETHDVIQSTNTTYQSFIQDYVTAGTYIRLNDDLCKLSYNDRSIILRSASDSVICMGAAFAEHYYNLFSLPKFLNAIEVTYGKRMVDIHRWAMKFIDPDVILIKLSLSLFALSETTFLYSPNISMDLTNSINILKIQNKYAEIIWKYLFYRYGHEQAVKRFLNLICWRQAINIFIFHAQNLTLHVHDVNSIVEQTELKLILDDADQILQMNKS